ncbi:MAG: phospholipid carrier-dependent glycosyltransferase [Bacteroidales bacterium]|nr:phospholipid carrier-dependent glycosyltransferase [Bacteroidales bacterium]
MGKTLQNKEIKAPAGKRRLIGWVIALVAVFFVAFTYIFNSKLDLNGDNCNYYIYSSAMAEGFGYADISVLGNPPTTGFPPGYPILMTPLRFFTDSFVAQKWLNGFFLLGSALLFFFWLLKQGVKDTLAFIAVAVTLLNYHVLHFTTMMMSEPSTLFFTVWALWLLGMIDDKKPFWKDPYFWLLVVVVGFAYHIRTQLVTLFAAILVYFAFNKRWMHLLGMIAGFAVTLLPWIIRNKVLNLNYSRYLDMMTMANPWRPEEGALGFGEFMGRFFQTLRMLVTQALPNSVTPYFDVNYGEAPVLGNWIAGIAMIALIVFGFWQLGKYRYFLIAYPVFLFGLICLWSTPSENRYIVSLEPFLEIGLILGVYYLIQYLAVRSKMVKKEVTPWIMVIFLLVPVPRLQQLRAQNRSDFPQQYKNFFMVAEAVKKNLPSETVIASRKPSLFYMYSKSKTAGFPYSSNDKLVLKGLLDEKVEYVVLDELGYSATYLYLLPAIQKNLDLFQPVMQVPDSNTYLFKFDREKAQAKLTK